MKRSLAWIVAASAVAVVVGGTEIIASSSNDAGPSKEASLLAHNGDAVSQIRNTPLYVDWAALGHLGR